MIFVKASGEYLCARTVASSIECTSNAHFTNTAQRIEAFIDKLRLHSNVFFTQYHKKSNYCLSSKSIDLAFISFSAQTKLSTI